MAEGQNTEIIQGQPKKQISSPEIEDQSLPEVFRIKENVQLTLSLWNALPPQFREMIQQKTGCVVFPNGSTDIGDGKVTPSKKQVGLSDVNIGFCLNPKYYSELFYHEINHVAESAIPQDMQDRMNEAAKTLYEELKIKGIMMDTSHLLTDTLPIYVLYPQALNKLSADYRGWDMASKVYGELLGEISPQKREKIFQEIENVKNKSASSNYEFLEKIRKGQEKGYLLEFGVFNEVKDLLQPAANGAKIK